MAFTLTGLPRFYNLTKTAWDAGVDAGKIEAGAVYFVTDGTETTLYVGKADNAFLTITDPTVASQITAAIDAITAADIELSSAYVGKDTSIKAGDSVELAIKTLHDRIAALAGTEGDDLDLTSLNAAVTELKAATAGFSSTTTVAAGIAAGVEEAKGYTDDEIGKLTIAGLQDYATVITGPLALKANASEVYSKTEADGKFELIGTAYTKSEADNLLNGKVDKSAYDEQIAKLATTDALNGAKSELKGNIDKKVDQTAYDADKATFALAANVYSKTDADGKFETIEGAAGKYALIGAAYTKGEADGKFATIADYSTTAVMSQAIADAKAAVIGTAEDGASVDTVKGAKAYADSLITGLGAVFEFKGTANTYADLAAITGMEKGDVYLVLADENQAGTVTNAEYVYDGAKWELLGNTALDTTNFVQSTVELTAGKIVLGNGGKGVKVSDYSIGGTTTVAGTEYMLATEKAVKADFDALNVDINEIIGYLSWQTTM